MPYLKPVASIHPGTVTKMYATDKRFYFVFLCNIYICIYFLFKNLSDENKGTVFLNKLLQSTNFTKINQKLHNIEQIEWNEILFILNHSNFEAAEDNWGIAFFIHLFSSRKIKKIFERNLHERQYLFLAPKSFFSMWLLKPNIQMKTFQ